MDNSSDKKDYLTPYYLEERSSLEDAVTNGSLRKIELLDGALYVLVMSSLNYAIAADVNGMIVRHGDKVVLERPNQSDGVWSLTTRILDFEIDEGPHELRFKTSTNQDKSLLGVLVFHHVKENLSAVQRAVETASRLQEDKLAQIRKDAFMQTLGHVVRNIR